MIVSEKDVTEANLAREMRVITDKLGLTDLSQAVFPKYFQIETTRVCNSRCPYCPVDHWDKSHPFMTDWLFDKIAEELADYRDWVRLNAVQRAGEPLMDKKLVARVKKLKDNGMRGVTIATNAMLLDEKRARGLIEAGLDEIMFSIDSVEEEKYKKIKVGLDFKQVIANIERFFALREELRPELIVRVRGVSFHDFTREEDQDSYDGWEHFWGRFRKPHDRIYMKKAHNWGNQWDWDGNIRQNSQVYHPCIVPWSTMHITAMGIVGLCPTDYDGKMNLGDVNQSSIRDIWLGEAFARLREQHRSGRRNEVGFCNGCMIFDPEGTLEEKE